MLTTSSRTEDKDLPVIQDMVKQALSLSLGSKMTDPGIYYLKKIWSEKDPYNVAGEDCPTWRWWLECVLLDSSTVGNMPEVSEPAGMTSSRADLQGLFSLALVDDLLVSVAADGQMTRLVGVDVELIED